MITRDYLNRFKRKVKVGYWLKAPVEIYNGHFMPMEGKVIAKYKNHATVEYVTVVEGFDGRPRKVVRKESFQWVDLAIQNMGCAIL